MYFSMTFYVFICMFYIQNKNVVLKACNMLIPFNWNQSKKKKNSNGCQDVIKKYNFIAIDS